jgi:hypothetical protein
MTDEATATQPGAAQTPAPQNTAPSVKDRITSLMGRDFITKATDSDTQSEQPNEETPEKPATESPAPKPQEATQEESTQEGEETTEETETEETPLVTLKDLAERAGLDYESILDLEAPTKVDGKEGKAKIRDVIKSHQLEQHLNAKLMTHAETVKAKEAEFARVSQEHQQKTMQLEAATLVAQQLLNGELSSVNWAELQANDPETYKQKYFDFDTRQRQINAISEQLGQERQKHQQAQEAAYNAYKTEQAKLLDSKLPEWSNTEAKNQDIADMVTHLGELGVSEKELRSLVDHRDILIARLATKWLKLQKSKPTVVNKVKTAPKALKPGAIQSRAATDSLALKNARDRLKATGKGRDAVEVFKRLGVV